MWYTFFGYFYINQQMVRNCRRKKNDWKNTNFAFHIEMCWKVYSFFETNLRNIFQIDVLRAEHFKHYFVDLYSIWCIENIAVARQWVNKYQTINITFHAMVYHLAPKLSAPKRCWRIEIQIHEIFCISQMCHRLWFLVFVDFFMFST